MLPIESLEMRYSSQWLSWFKNIMIDDKRVDSLVIIDPDPLTTEITNGAFLDVCGTNYYKAMQLASCSEMIHNGQVDENTVFFMHDAWFPGIEMLAYMRDGLGIKFKIAGCLHAGTYDPTDFTSKKGMGMWGRDLEQSWFELYDKLFVATSYHKNLIQMNRVIVPDKLVVTGFPIYKPLVDMGCAKEKIVVFPHRLTEDKQPELFDELARLMSSIYPDWQFIKTQDVKRTKQEYYDLLRRASIAVSFAKHENWGIGMQEATMVGCIPVVPDRLSYKEMYSPEFRFADFADAFHRVYTLIHDIKAGNMHNYYRIWDQDRIKMERAGWNAITNMIGELLGL
jgi:hypothetical protein